MEQLLSVFDQENRTSDIHILNVREEDFPEKHRPVIRRLKMAASDHELKRKMQEEDKHIRYLQNIERGAHYQGRIEGEAIGLEKGEIIGVEKGRAEGEAERAQLQTERAQLQAEHAQLQAQLQAALARIALLEQNKR